jgi:Domain of unknown function (DUF5134)
MARAVGVSDPAFIDDLLAAVMLGIAAYCVARVLVVRRLRRTLHYDVNTFHAVMGVGMAGMFVPRLNALPTSVWEAVFGGFAAWFSWRSLHSLTRGARADRPANPPHGLSHDATHLVMCGAMLYMYAAAVPARAGGGAAMAVGDIVALPLVFVLVLIGSAVAHLDALARFAPAQLGVVFPDPGASRWLAPRLEMACHVVMAVGMALMLVLMF